MAEVIVPVDYVEMSKTKQGREVLNGDSELHTLKTLNRSLEEMLKDWELDRQCSHDS